MNRVSRSLFLIAFSLLLVACAPPAVPETPASTDDSVTLTVLNPTEAPTADPAAAAAESTTDLQPTAAAPSDTAAQPTTSEDDGIDERQTVEFDGGTAILSGSLTANSETSYTLPVPADETLRVNYTADNDSVLTIYNPDGTIFAIDAANFTDCCGTMTQEGDYALIVRSGANEVNYEIDVAVGDDIVAAEDADGETDESEQSDTEADTDAADTASTGDENRIEFEGDTTGTIVGNTLAANTVDKWLLDAGTGQVLSLRLFPYPTKQFTVTSPTGSELVFVEAGGNFIADMPETGDYVIEVSGALDGGYSLTVELIGVPAEPEN